jgi:hypothetical protein
MFEIANTARQKTIVEIHDETLKEIKKNESVTISSLSNS